MVEQIRTITVTDSETGKPADVKVGDVILYSSGLRERVVAVGDDSIDVERDWGEDKT